MCSCSSRSIRFPNRSLGSHSGSLKPPFPTRSRPDFSLRCGWIVCAELWYLPFHILGFLCSLSPRFKLQSVSQGSSSLFSARVFSPHFGLFLLTASMGSSLLFLGHSCPSGRCLIPVQLLPSSATSLSAHTSSLGSVAPPQALPHLYPEMASNQHHFVALTVFVT